MEIKYKMKQDESKNGDAIIAIDESGYGHMLIMLTSDEKKIQFQDEYDVLPEIHFVHTSPGLYYANMKVISTFETLEIEWEIVKPLYPIVKDFKNQVEKETK